MINWHKVKLGDVAKINPRVSILPGKFVYIDLESVVDGSLIKRDVIYKDKAPSRAQRLLTDGDIIFQTVRPYQRNNLIFNGNDDLPVVASTGYAQIRYRGCPLFMYYVLHLDNFVDAVLSKCTGSNYPAITASDLAEIDINIPSVHEQEAIVEAIQDFDDYLEKVRKKLEATRQLKKGLSQRIFSGQLRFKDDGGQDFPGWEYISLKNILKERKSYSEKGKGYEHVSLTKDGVVPKGERYNRDFLVKDDEIKKYKITKLGDICYNPANLKFGVICRNNYRNGIFSPIYITFEIKNANEKFIEHFLTNPGFIGRALSYEQGTVYERMAVSPEDMLTMNVYLPSLNEQQKIADFLGNVDELISSFESLLESAKLQKKWLLDNLVTGKIRLKEFRDE